MFLTSFQFLFSGFGSCPFSNVVDFCPKTEKLTIRVKVRKKNISAYYHEIEFIDHDKCTLLMNKW